MNIITLTTDFGEQDYSVGALKGHLYHLLPEARIVDISHQVERYSISEAAYLLQGAYSYFPQGTIHIIGVNNELHFKKPLLVLKYNEQYFIVADNGFISLFTRNESNLEIYCIPLESEYSIFPTLDFSAKIAQLLCQKTPLSQIGIPYKEHLYVSDFMPKIHPNRIEGSIIYIDYFGNLISNITKELLERESQGRRFNVYFRYQVVKNISVEEIYTQYNQAEKQQYSEGNPFLVFNKLGYLEMAIYKGDPTSSGSSSTLIGMKRGNPMSVDFI
ncbi:MULTISPECIES: SAM hydrolase/SAM-dependent halogenase family protein [unclassified Capnocytophaga]|jgi:Uncharacterized conserved protein|uniref:SAM hydrolase/SAM-dependent halogenase family protein n=1 Tax=unclassified Capnocytophaga TaxID=2640652 RepID=UPI000202B2DF|nr:MULTISPECIES: SAM-dependent chlorinase/fluorinase [unclassified Capnocytophaga]EGD35196.1 protein containing DUF62 [Capnocytophaga sp. oral taxon 338 str. F0234]MEB3003815.1 SAM-dependent chlorinase/fluorinase [Capnocytophaga sp. G2]